MGWAFDAGKIALTALIIFSIAQISERSTLMAAVLASIPIVSVLSMMMILCLSLFLVQGWAGLIYQESAADLFLCFSPCCRFVLCPYLST